jgi:hypothetical protein
MSCRLPINLLQSLDNVAILATAFDYVTLTGPMAERALYIDRI